MRTPEEVAAACRLHALGWGTKRIAAELGMSRTTVKKLVRAGGWSAYKKPDRARSLDGLEEWLRAELLTHRGNAAVVHRELATQKGLEVTLRTVQRAVKPFRDELAAQARATVRFETRPGRQLQVDFGQVPVLIGGVKTRVHLAVMTLGYSRRHFVCAFACERQDQWLSALERAFEHFGGVPEELLLDNAASLVTRHDARTREVTFHPRLAAFCRHWGVRPVACAPYRARTKGKVERGVGYIKRNAIAGYGFESWEALEGHLEWWMREVSDVRVHGTTGDRPIERFVAEKEALQPLASRPSFQRRRSLRRRVQADCCVELDTNHYSVPYVHLGKDVTVEVADGVVQVLLAGQVIAEHDQLRGARQWKVEPRHLEGVVRAAPEATDEEAPTLVGTSELLRPLSVYEQVAGGAL